MGDPGIHVWTGQSGQNYRYTVYMFGTVFGPGPANHIFAHETRPNQFMPIYIGQTDDLSEPFDNHVAPSVPISSRSGIRPAIRCGRRQPRGCINALKRGSSRKLARSGSDSYWLRFLNPLAIAVSTLSSDLSGSPESAYAQARL